MYKLGILLGMVFRHITTFLEILECQERTKTYQKERKNYT